MRPVYLDNAATTAVRREAVEAMLPFFRTDFANPSSAHASGQRVRRALDDARESTAAALGARPHEIIFTASGSEADALALFGILGAGRKRRHRLITSAVEHHAVLHAAAALADRGCDVCVLPVDGHGFVSPDVLASALEAETALVSMMHGNNEIGTIAQLRELADIAHERGALFHTDAVQTVGHVPVEVGELHVDALSLSAHKFGGPKGAGALFLRDGVGVNPIVFGGGQEGGRRSGTENVAGIVGLSVALQLAVAVLPESARRVAALRDRLIDGALLQVRGSECNGPRDRRLPNNASLRFEGIEATMALMALEQAGFEASTGSACASGSLNPSHVLSAIGLDAAAARSTIRFSLSEATESQDIERLLAVLPQTIERLRQLSAVFAPAG